MRIHSYTWSVAYRLCDICKANVNLRGHTNFMLNNVTFLLNSWEWLILTCIYTRKLRVRNWQDWDTEHWGSFGRQHVMTGKRWMWGIKPTNKQKRILKRKEEGPNYIIKYIQTLRKNKVLPSEYVFRIWLTRTLNHQHYEIIKLI